jgi:restriction endonuclease Mrr
MGYGGSRRDADQAVGRAKDEGIDGDQLAQFMIDNNVGVTPVQTYEIKRIDRDATEAFSCSFLQHILHY